jgi:hypothetical protein
MWNKPEPYHPDGNGVWGQAQMCECFFADDFFDALGQIGDAAALISDLY